MSDYLQISWRNSCDLAGSVFQKPETAFFYVMYLDVEVGQPTFELSEDGVEDGEKEFVPDFKKLVKRYQFDTIIPEYQLDAMCAIMLHDTIFIRLKNEEKSRVRNFTVTPGDWVEKDMIRITVSFTVRYDIATACCNNEKIVYRPCYQCNPSITAVNWVDVNDTTQWNDRTWVLRGVTDLLTGEKSNNSLYFYRYSTQYNGSISRDGRPTNGGLYDGRENEMICFTHSGIAHRFYFKNGYWNLAQVIRSATLSGTDVTVRCWAFPDVFAQLYILPPAGVWTAVGSPVLASVIQNVGVKALGCVAGNNSFKVLLYDNNCNYGYSNTVVVAV